jgi:3-hydroxy-D-aspartate aldolase
MTEASSPLIGVSIDCIDTPALLVDLDRLEHNLAAMAALVANTGIQLRPHVKSHKSPLVAKRQLALGAAGVCCAKVGEAEVMVAAGIPDVLVTTEVVTPEKIRRLVALARHATVAVVVDNPANALTLSEAAAAAHVTLNVLVEVDVGQHRCGLDPGAAAADLADQIARLPGLRFRGLQGYQGSLQQLVSHQEREAQIRHALSLLLETAELVRKRGHQIKVLTGGGSGSSAIDIALHGLTELQPGSYVFMDCNYRRIEWEGGSTAPFEASLSVLTSVVSCTSPERVIVDAGWKAASCDSGMPVLKTLEGATFTFAGDEHGKIALPAGAGISPGDKLELIPSHCDTTVNLHDQYVCVRRGKVESVWPILARGRTQ